MGLLKRGKKSEIKAIKQFLLSVPVVVNLRHACHGRLLVSLKVLQGSPSLLYAYLEIITGSTCYIASGLSTIYLLPH